MVPVPHGLMAGNEDAPLDVPIPFSPSGPCVPAQGSDSAQTELSHQVKPSRVISQVASSLVNTV